ncbi:MAG: radical SAM protein [Acidobacteriota bacterium]|nr:radical SAM protein [Acidobacteriota bacterium]
MGHWRLHPELPVFGVEDGEVAAAYVPGRVMPASGGMLRKLRALWAGAAPDGARRAPEASDALIETARRLEGAAATVAAAWQRLHREDFAPACLNILLPYACDLSCGYCYARPGAAQPPRALDRAAVAAAARRVAANCARMGVPLQVDIQGEGEPARRWDDLRWCVEATRAAAREARVKWSAHLSTNGQVDAAQAGWMKRTFSHVTLSCDGPPDIQDACRPRRDGGRSSVRLEAAAALLASGAQAVDARVTVTAANVHRLGEVVDYIVETLGIRSVRLEPAFAPASAEGFGLAPEEVAAACLRACEAGGGRGVEVTLGSPRLTELHGAYCQTLRGILRLRPEGDAANCLHGVHAGFAFDDAVGDRDAATGEYACDRALVARLRRQAEDVPASCRDCVNVFHCARSCPDHCPTPDMAAGGWRCRFQKAVAEHWILAAAREARPSPQTGGGGSRLRRQVEAEARAIPDPSAREAVVDATLLAAARYPLAEAHMPNPAWADGRRLRRDADPTEALTAAAAAGGGAVAAYVHLPFCSTRCVFCDCHSVAAGRDAGGRFDAYAARLGRDLDIWRGRGRIGERPVSTVHFGGGTPLALGLDRLSKVVAMLGEGLGADAQTQWAVETTASRADAIHVEGLAEMGFRRLHVGVQTLHDALRRRLGRVCGSGEVVARLGAAMRAGMVTSVDLLYGMPGQTAGMLLEDLSRLVDAGVQGFSLYRLNLSARNRGMARVFGECAPDPLRSCVMLQAAEAALLRAGYRKNHYAHYALPPDDNRYYRHAVRGEDLLGLGASAAGAFGGWEYRCADYPRYMDGGTDALPVALLARHPPGEGRKRRVVANLMAGRLPADIANGGGADGGAADAVLERLIRSWAAAGLLARDWGEDGEGLRLTATGSWLAGRMVDELQDGASG